MECVRLSLLVPVRGAVKYVGLPPIVERILRATLAEFGRPKGNVALVTITWNHENGRVDINHAKVISDEQASAVLRAFADSIDEARRRSP